MEKKINLLIPADKRKELREDLKFLENLSDSNHFSLSLPLFKKKWASQKEFLKVFV